MLTTPSGRSKSRAAEPASASRHEPPPDPGGERASADGAAMNVVHGTHRVRVPDPDRRRQLWDVADEPRVCVVLRGPRLARSRPADVGLPCRCPWSITPRRMSVISQARGAGTACRGVTAAENSVLPSDDLTDCREYGVARRPPAARVAYAPAISSGETPRSRPPSAIAGTALTSLVMPSVRAVAATFSAPMASTSRGEDRVDRPLSGGDKRGRSASRTGDLPRPAFRQLERRRARVEPLARRHAFSEGRGQHEGLEGGARLASALDRDVESLLRRVAPAHQGPDRSRARLHGDEGGGRVARAVEDRGHGCLGRPLGLRVQRRLHREPAS